MAAVIDGFINQSGGACKTTTVSSLGVLFPRFDLRTLVVDADGQRDLSKIYGYDRPERIPNQRNITDVIRGTAAVSEAIVSPELAGRYRGVDLLLGGLFDAELESHIATRPLK